MSCFPYFAHPKPVNSSSLIIKTDEQLRTQREDFHKTQNSHIDFEIINKVYEIVRSIRDAEFPYTMEHLDMVNETDIEVESKRNQKHIKVHWKPSSPSCRFATHIGLAIRLKLERELTDYEKIKLTLLIKSGGHKQQKIIDKQINDKERTAAAMENEELLNFIENLIS